MNAADIVAGLSEALGKRDAYVAECPVRNPKKGQRFTPKCVRCGAGPSNPCAAAVHADCLAVEAVRAILDQTNG